MKLLRAGVCGVLAFAVLSHGAVEPWAQAVLECAAGLLLGLWALYFFGSGRGEQIAVPTMLFPLAAFAVVVIVQLSFRLSASAFTTRIELQLLLSMLILLF